MTGSNSEIRQNLITQEWVIFAPNRGDRPKQSVTENINRGSVPSFDKSCPFCPGNEAMLPEILLELPGQNSAGWQTRSVPNKFPALQPITNSFFGERANFYTSRPGYGRHEVIIEHPLHNHDIPNMSIEEVEHVIETYQRRWLELLKDQQILFAALFRNHGPGAGTSLIHPHSQLIAVDILPRNELLKRRNAHDYFIQNGRCLLCDILAHEKVGPRMVLENESFTAFVPFSAEAPFETWLVPQGHHNSFGGLPDGEKGRLAQILHKVLARLVHAAGDPDYNYVIHSQLRSSRDDPELHWYIQIKPRTTTRAGFEIGSGMRINPSLPEEDARQLRG